MIFNEIVKLAIKDDNQETLFEIIFSDDYQIDKQQMLNFLNSIVTSADENDINIEEAKDCLHIMQNDNSSYQNFLNCLKAELAAPDPDYPNAKPESFDLLDKNIFWSMTAISMKKCLGSNNANAMITDLEQYYRSIPEQLNNAQKICHIECIKYFNMDANNFSREKNKELALYLHEFHSKNKRIKTRKKNLQRVKKRIKRIMQIYKLAHNRMPSNIFSKKRYKVPEQFAKSISTTYLTK